MAGSPALLLLLSLGLCCTGAQRQRDAVVVSFNRNMKHPQQGQRLELECWRNKTSWRVSWIRLDRDGNLHYILSSYSTNTTIFQGGERTSPRYEATWSENICRLVVKSFSTEDEGIYFCISFNSAMRNISSGQPAFFPVTSRALLNSFLTANTQSSQVTMKDISRHSPGQGTNNENTPHFCHDIVMSVNLACSCLLLLTAITITITHCQRPSSP